GRAPQETDLIRSLAYLAEQTEAIRVYQSEHPTPAAPAANTANTKSASATKSATPEPPPAAPDPQLEALASLCQVLYSSNRFLYIE
ncbi:MAG TPA: hypothetical protein VK961_05380, partial [Chthoniobacter sp.]|nr:hypothetical protein [Chthoniobacter sp.]